MALFLGNEKVPNITSYISHVSSDSLGLSAIFSRPCSVISVEIVAGFNNCSTLIGDIQLHDIVVEETADCIPFFC